MFPFLKERSKSTSALFATKTGASTVLLTDYLIMAAQKGYVDDLKAQVNDKNINNTDELGNSLLRILRQSSVYN
jgi:hypothetical protein